MLLYTIMCDSEKEADYAAFQNHIIYIIVKNIDIYDNSDLQCLTLQAGMSPHIHFFYFNGYKTPIIPLRTVEEIVLPVMMDFKGFKSLNKRNREF